MRLRSLIFIKKKNIQLCFKIASIWTLPCMFAPFCFYFPFDLFIMYVLYRKRVTKSVVIHCIYIRKHCLSECLLVFFTLSLDYVLYSLLRGTVVVLITNRVTTNMHNQHISRNVIRRLIFNQQYNINSFGWEVHFKHNTYGNSKLVIFNWKNISLFLSIILLKFFT